MGDGRMMDGTGKWVFAGLGIFWRKRMEFYGGRAPHLSFRFRIGLTGAAGLAASIDRGYKHSP